MPRSCQTTFFCYLSWKGKKKEQRGNKEAYRKYVEDWTSTKENVQQWEEKLQETQLPKETSTYKTPEEREKTSKPKKSLRLWPKQFFYINLCTKSFKPSKV